MNAILENSRSLSTVDLGIPRAKTSASAGLAIGFWSVTAIFCLQIGFTAYAQLTLPQVAAAFAHLAVGDGPEAWGFAAATGVLWGVSYLLWRRRAGRQA